MGTQLCRNRSTTWLVAQWVLVSPFISMQNRRHQLCLLPGMGKWVLIEDEFSYGWFKRRSYPDNVHIYSHVEKCVNALTLCGIFEYSMYCSRRGVTGWLQSSGMCTSHNLSLVHLFIPCSLVVPSFVIFRLLSPRPFLFFLVICIIIVNVLRHMRLCVLPAMDPWETLYSEPILSDAYSMCAMCITMYHYDLRPQMYRIEEKEGCYPGLPRHRAGGSSKDQGKQGCYLGFLCGFRKVLWIWHWAFIVGHVLIYSRRGHRYRPSSLRLPPPLPGSTL